MLKRLGFLLIIAFIGLTELFATHQRAAEITYKWLGGFTYEITITMYTYTPSPADDDRVFLPINFGDNTLGDIPRIVFTNQPDNYTLNIYRMEHTFPAAGSYTISVEDPNRNFGVVNIPNSVNVPIYVESELIINPFLGNNNSVQLLNPPIDQGCVGKLYLHNPSAYDPDGDSLSYRLVNCRGAGGLEIPGYTEPRASDFFGIDEFTGELRWDTPLLQGEYNVAFMVEEWRQGVKVGSVVRDMQILIGACNNNPPEISTLNDTCVIAGTNFTFDVIATDAEGNKVSLSATGAPFELPINPAVIVPDPAVGQPEAQTSFFWDVACRNVRLNPYQVLFKARDEHPEVSLTNFKTVSIRVIAPPIENLTAEALGKGIELNWNNAPCDNAIEFRIYRRNGSSGFEPGYCETGVPSYTGYQFIERVENINTLTFRDDNSGNGLVPGIDYCYLITSVFQDGSESLASNEACASLKRDIPVITHVSNDSLDLITGNVLTAWSPPTEIDSLQYPPPYRYNLIRYLGSETTIVFTGTGLLDTLYTDNSININEINQPLAYAVELENDQNGSIGSSPRANALSLDVLPTDEALVLRWDANVPWTNDSFDIYRQTTASADFEFINRVYSQEFLDDNLTNGSNYCYYIKSYGGYSTSGIVHPIINFSPIVCAVPVDNIPPCPPVLSVETNCETIDNTLSWQNPVADSCKNDAVTYLIYFTPIASESFVLIDSITNPADSSWVHENLDIVIGCYHIKARDEKGNISAASNIVCVDYDTCPLYELPNVFTPNADSFNDLWIPMKYPSSNPKATVESISLVVFNRWGNTVFETTNPEIEWDGKNQENGKDCSGGTYFYVCDIFIKTFDGQIKQTLKGSVNIIR